MIDTDNIAENNDHPFWDGPWIRLGKKSRNIKNRYDIRRGNKPPTAFFYEEVENVDEASHILVSYSGHQEYALNSLAADNSLRWGEYAIPIAPHKAWVSSQFSNVKRCKYRRGLYLYVFEKDIVDSLIKSIPL